MNPESPATSLNSLTDFVENDNSMGDESLAEFEPVEEFKNKISTEELRQFDIIQYDCGSYSHWALYFGDGNIIHFMNSDGNLMNGNGKVLQSQIDYSDEHYPCRVNNLTKQASRKSLNARSFVEIMISVAKDLAKVQFKYKLLTNNCGHFVTKWKFGTKFNPEVDKVVKATLLTAAGVANTGVAAGGVAAATQDTVAATVDGVAATQDKVAATVDGVAATQDKVAATQDEIAAKQDEVAATRDKVESKSRNMFQKIKDAFKF